MKRAYQNVNLWIMGFEVEFILLFCFSILKNISAIISYFFWFEKMLLCYFLHAETKASRDSLTCQRS